MLIRNLNKWPKIFESLTPEQEAISNDFMEYWHSILPARYNILNQFNNEYVVKHAPADFITTIEIGAGDGEHLSYENLSELQRKHYHAIDIRENMVNAFKIRSPDIHAIIADCQTRMPFEDHYFDRVLAIHVLEHLPNLPAAIQEMHRLCNKEKGIFSVVIPCEGGLAYSIARKISAERIFKKRYNQPYDWFIQREHINTPDEILEELKHYFNIETSSYFPIPIPLQWINLCIGLTLTPK